ncbi:P-loop containing nucleoside triphosphate hydrolase protein [Auriscalpium vulgare]|uniref:P-loop containing nucleoside triphosphate hydrolase protein n=1 Tax=Auriscalpium vulgare TaxID=40419 RepID=A0ACB8RGS9_9AGAM|nr:P-loop containing nucleoside triphosphate hydrolase protein [Auriscalpium vulgare]
MRRSHLVQNILNPKKVECLWFSSSEVVEVAEWVDRLKAQFVAVAVALSSRGQVVAIAFATPTEVAHISWDVANSTQRPLDRSCVQNIFRAPRKTFVAFDMAHIILLLRETFGCQLTGVDLSTLGQPDDGHPQSPGSFIASSLSGGIQQRDVHNIWERLRTDEEKYLKLAYQAWITAIGAKASRKLLPSAIRLSSAIVPDNLASILGSLVQSTWLLREHVKLENDGEITEAKWNEKGEITLFNARYKSRVRKSRNTTIELMMEDGFRLVGKAVTVREKITILEPLDGDQFAQPGARIEEVTVLGREEATSSERARDVLLRRLLQGDFKLQDSNFICRIWDPSTQVPNAPTLPTLAAPLSRQGLNNSQYRVVNAMLSSHPRDSLVIVHGPPGTGKTTTIARAAREWVAQGESVWITAQKNVAVKNIATSLVKLGVDFRLLVSPEFYYGWHEHLYYDAIRDRTIVTEILSSDPVAIRELLGSVYVILCPISMLSNPVLDNCGAYQIHPVKNLVVDEASQIQAFEYLPVFHKMRDTLQKACFFGDPKQLPPYGHEFAQLQSVFDVRHLKKSSYLLDTQYRMPARLGQFLSDHVYEKKLISHRKDSSTGCVTFVDVASGQEEQEGTSWKVRLR